MNDASKTYLGDSVYVEKNAHQQVVLTTSNGYPDDPRNMIVLEPETLGALNLWLKAQV